MPRISSCLIKSRCSCVVQPSALQLYAFSTRRNVTLLSAVYDFFCYTLLAITSSAQEYEQEGLVVASIARDVVV